MKSIKPGRGPSLMGGIGGIVAGIFGVIWIIATSNAGAPGFFTAFGVVFVLMALGGAVYNLVNASGKRRFSAFDITDENEEPDPLNERFSSKAQPRFTGASTGTGFCPYCGAKAEKGYLYCRSCGKKLPDNGAT